MAGADRKDSRRILVVAAMPGETAGLRRRLRDRRKIRKGALRLEVGRFASDNAVASGFTTGDADRDQAKEFWVAHCGMGESAARRFARSLKASGLQFDALVVIGLAGGLDPGLGQGDLVLVERVMDASGDLVWRDEPGERGGPDETGRSFAEDAESRLGDTDPASGTPRGPLITSPSLVTTPHAKSELWQSLGSPGNAIVDMETAFLVAELQPKDSELAVSMAAPNVLCLRVVSDTANESLPAFLERLVGAGPVRAATRVAAFVLRRPGRIGELLELRRRLVSGAERMGAWLEKDYR